MRGRLSIFIFVAFIVALLIALNAASYVRVEREPELESSPDRSTSNAGPTGTRAIYEYLAESGHKVMRWREPTDVLLKPNGAQPATFVVVGAVQRQFTDEEKKNLARWVARGGRLVVIDRVPEKTLTSGARWGVASSMSVVPGSNARADDVEKLLAGASPLAPTQPTLLASGVERIAPSRFASRLYVVGKTETNEPVIKSANPAGAHVPTPIQTPPHAAARDVANRNDENDDDEIGSDEEEEPPPPKPTVTPTVTPATRATPSRPTVIVPHSDYERGVGAANDHSEDRAEPDAPVLNFTDERGALVADFARGRGHVIILSDPFIIANNGITRADNLQLAVNVLTSGGSGGLIAFDEYHQGRGETHNQLITYFAGTPVIAMFAQIVLIVALVVWSRGRRFARPLPAPRPDRRSKLEFVASMAELQQRARAFDLALENIYSRTRRALARYGGTDLAAPYAAVAAAVAARSGTDRARLEELMRECEDAAAGAPLSARRALALAASLRELERTLGIRMRAREIKQAGRL